MTNNTNPDRPTMLIDDIDRPAALKALASLVVFAGIIAALLSVVGAAEEPAGEAAALTTRTDESIVQNTSTSIAEGATTASTDGGESGTTNNTNPDPEQTGPNPGAVTTGVTTGDGGAGGEQPGAHVVEPTSPPIDQCLAVLEAGRAVLVTPDPLILPSGSMSGELQITNCTDDAVAWSALTKPWVELAHSTGSLNPGSSSPLGFTIDSAAVEPGAVDFKIKVSTPGANTYVDVSAFRESFGTDFVDPTMGLTAGEGAGGCKNSCISRAWLSSTVSTPNVTLEMATKVPAKMWVFVSLDAPVIADGRPGFPGVLPASTLDTFGTTWTTTIDSLEAATKYHIIVKATDENGNSQWETSSFTTRSSAVGPTDFAGPGCELQCIRQALVTATGEPGTVSIDVSTIVPTAMELFVSATPFPYNESGTTAILAGQPTVTNGAVPSRAWTTTVGGLEPATTYYLGVRATDGDGDVSTMAGSFTTEPPAAVDLTVRLHEIRITHDGDPFPGNRGEIALGWSVDGENVVTIGEQKLENGDTVELDPAAGTFRFENVAAGSNLLPVRVWAVERDTDFFLEFCQSWKGGYDEPGSDSVCDVRFNVSEHHGFVFIDQLDALPQCWTYGIEGAEADQPCLLLTSMASGDQDAQFEAVVSLTVSES